MLLSEYSKSTEVAAQRLKDYCTTFLTRDVRELANIKDLANYEKFLRTLALYSSRTFNLSQVSREISVKQSTLNDWLGTLEAGYIIWKLRGYAKKISKREAKSIKPVFIDAGLQTSLLGYQTEAQLQVSPLRESIFETAVLNAIRNLVGGSHSIYYWRANDDYEVDCVIENSFEDLIPVEIKFTSNPNEDDTRGISAFSRNTMGRRSVCL